MLIGGLSFGKSIAKIANFITQPKPVSLPPPVTSPINKIISNKGLLTYGLNSVINKNLFVSPFVHQYIPPVPVIPVNSIKSRTDTRLQNNLGVASVNSTPFESLTGISETRPEIMLMTSFRPLYNDNFLNQSQNSMLGEDLVEGFSSAGSFLDVQMQVANLRYYNMYSLVKELKKDKAQAEVFAAKEAYFYKQIEKLTFYVNYLYATSNLIEKTKETFNIRSSNNRLIWHNVFQSMWPNEYQKLSQFAATQGLGNDTWIPDILKQFGFNEDNIKQFSNTKIYLQLVVELNQLLKGYSNTFSQISNKEHTSDNQSLVINSKNNKNLNDQIGEIESPIYEDVTRLNGRSIPLALPKITSFLKGIESVMTTSTQENKISLLCYFLSREYRNSFALADNETKKLLLEKYAYAVNNNGSNLSVFDFITGKIGSKITDAFSTPTVNALCNPSQILKNINASTTLVLPFESSYVESGPSIFSPGTEYLIDSIVDTQNLETKEVSKTGFDVSRLKEYTQNLNNVVENFSEIITKLKLLEMIPDSNEAKGNASQFVSPTNYADVIFSNVRQETNNQVNFEIASDIISGIVNHSSKSELLKSNLFLYFMSDYAAESDKAGIRNVCIDGIMSALKASTAEKFDFFDNNFNFALNFYNIQNPFGLNLGYNINQRYQLQNKNDKVDETTIKDKFLSGKSPMIVFIKKAIKDAVDAFSVVLNGTRTWYSDVNMTMIVGCVFELCLTVSKQFIGKEVSSQNRTFAIYNVGQPYFTISNIEIANTFVYSDVNKAISGEIVKNYYVISGLITMLRKIVNESTSLINSLRDETSVNTLNEIIAVLGNRTMLSKLMNEQQLILAKSLVDDINLRLHANDESNSENSLDAFSELTNKSDVILLDDIIVRKNLRNAIFSFFAQDRFSGNKAYNMKLLTVGIPSGFSGNIKEKIKLSDLNQSSYNKKQTDVINVCVYKVDMEYQDIIFKPQKFLFELSRFVHKNDSTYGQISIADTIDKLTFAIPTTDYSIELANGDRNSPVKKSDSDLSVSDLFTNIQYEFLSNDQKTKMLGNHITSFMLEIYLKFMTGLIVSEHNFTIDDSMNDTRGLDEELIKSIVDISLSRRLREPVDENITNLDILNEDSTSKIVRDLIIHDNAVANDIGSIRSQFSDEMHETRKILTPKLFDRVFNLAIDPDDFEIDVDATRKTTQGVEAFSKLLKQGIAIDVSLQEQAQQGTEITKRYKLKDKMKTENHVIFDKYFVVIETAAPTTKDDAEQEQDKIKQKYIG
jgi:hypothetical protein